MSFGKHFKDNDFTLYEKNGDIFSLHMKFNNFFRNQNLPAMIGGGKKNHLNINNGLSVPLGLALLNKQSDIKYDTETNKIIDITILKYNKEKNLFELKTRDNKVKITPKTKSKTNIDKLLNNSKKRR